MSFSSTIKITNGKGYLEYFFSNSSDYDRCNWKITVHSFHSGQKRDIVILKSRNVVHENKVDMDQNIYSTLVIGDFRENLHVNTSGNCQLALSNLPTKLLFEVHDLTGKIAQDFQGIVHVELIYKKKAGCH